MDRITWLRYLGAPVSPYARFALGIIFARNKGYGQVIRRASSTMLGPCLVQAASQVVALVAGPMDNPNRVQGRITRPRSARGSHGSDVTGEVATRSSLAVGQLVIRAVATRLVTLVGMIVLARLLDPEAFGVFAVITVSVTFISLAGDLGVTAALIQQHHDPTASELSTAFHVQLAFWSVITVVIWLAADFIPLVRPDLPSDGPGIARLMAVGFLLVALRAIPTVRLSRVLRFGPLAAVEVGQQVVYFGAAIVLAAADYGIWSFAIGALLQGVFATVALNVVDGYRIGRTFDRSIAARLLRFGIGAQAAHVFGWAREAVVPVFGGLAGGFSAVGYLGFAWRNGQLVSAIEQIVTTIMFPALSRLHGERRHRDAMVRSAVEFSFAPVAVIQGWIIATAPILVPTVFSAQWAPAVPALQIICVGSIAGAPTLVLRALLLATGRSGQGSLLAGVSLAVLLVTFPGLALVFGLSGAAFAFTATSFFGLGIHIFATRADGTFPWRDVLRVGGETALCSLVAAAVVALVPGLLGLFVASILYSVIVAIVAISLERPYLRAAFAILRPASQVTSPP